jgi:hypothetical protein
MDFKVNIGTNKISPSLKNKVKLLDAVPDQAYTFFKAHTPIKTGNARSRTVLKKDTIIAAYPYAQRLDDGYSRQAPDGMSKPTEAYIQKTVDKIMKRK